MLSRRSPLLLALLLAVAPACGSSSGSSSPGADSGGAEAEGPDAEPADSGTDDVGVVGEDSGSPASDASAPVDTGAGANDAAVEASVCVGLGSPCKDNSTCLCGEPSGCIWDNVACTGGVCAVTQAVPLDAGETCCSTCQAAYDSCTPQGPSCLSAWITCNGMCGACPVVCAAGP